MNHKERKGKTAVMVCVITIDAQKERLVKGKTYPIKAAIKSRKNKKMPLRKVFWLGFWYVP